MERRDSFHHIPSYSTVFVTGNLTPPSASDFFPSQHQQQPYLPGQPVQQQDCPPSFDSDPSYLTLTRPFGPPALLPGAHDPSFPNPDFPVAMADDFLPFPLSPSGLPPLDADEPLLSDLEQKYFAEFLDAFVEPGNPASASSSSYPPPIPQIPIPQTYSTQHAGSSNQIHDHHFNPPQSLYTRVDETSLPEHSRHQAVEQPPPPPNWNAPMPMGNSHTRQPHQVPKLYIDTSIRAPPPPTQAKGSASAPAPSYANHSNPTIKVAPPSNPSTPTQPPTTKPSPPPTQPPKNKTSPKPSSPNPTPRSKARLKSPSSKRRGGRDLLTDDQKRTNHIISEQRRRNLIRSGFKALADLVPGLKGGNLGSSKSVILYNTVGYIRHLEGSNRVLGEQLGMLQRRYDMVAGGGQREGIHPPPYPQPPPQQSSSGGRSGSNDPRTDIPVHFAGQQQTGGYAVEQNGRRKEHPPPPPPTT